VFYAGHGIEVNGTNYLIPVDAALERDLDVEDEAISLDRVTQILDPAKRLRMIILDACRDNPFLRSMKRTVSNRSIGRGLAKVDVQTTDTLIAFAAKAGFTAGDGEGSNSPFTVALLKHLTTPGLDLRLAFGRVRDEVLRSTGNRQEPAVYSLLGGAEIALVAGTASPVAVTVPPTPTQPQLSEAAQTWALIKDNTNEAVLDAYAKQFGDTVYGAMARARIEELGKQQVAVATPPEQLVRDEELRKALEEARAAREAAKVADEQRLAALQATESSTKAAEDKKRDAERASDPKKLAALPKIATPGGLRSFDGTWTVTWTRGACSQSGSSAYSLPIANGALGGKATSGRISATGSANWMYPSASDGAPIRFRGTFHGSTGSGTFARSDGKCAGTFTARRN
jgi:uncharacterized caspase-like protein